MRQTLQITSIAYQGIYPEESHREQAELESLPRLPSKINRGIQTNHD